MVAANITWGSSSTDANINASTIAASGSSASAAISNSGQWATECGLILTYNASATKGAKVEILRTNDGGTTYQADADGPYGFNLPFTANTTEHYVFTVMADVSQFKINVINLDTGQSITAATLKTRQANWQ
jgi:hypothetical protein